MVRDEVVAFKPLNPVTQGHMLFVPIYHDVMAWTVGEATAAAIKFATMKRYEDYNLIYSVGSLATQTIPHPHVHLVPRREGDGLKLPWSPNEA